MAKSKTHKWERVEVFWIDSSVIRRAWFGTGEFIDYAKDHFSNGYINTIGYKFYEDKKWLYLAMSLDYNDGQVVHFGNVFAIPKGCIQQIKKASKP